MKNLQVYLATTAGAVQVERLTREPALQSAVCLKRTTKQLAISRDYDAFVRQPTGVIEREFGPFESGAFRLDVSGPVDDGESWQLAVFAAHWLFSADRLARPGETVGTAIWLTGSLDNDLLVGSVAHLAEKLEASRRLFSTLLDEGVAVSAFLPPGGRAIALRCGVPEGLVLVEVATATKLGAALADLTGKDIESSSRKSAERHAAALANRPRERRRGLQWVLTSAAATLIVMVLALAVYMYLEVSVWRDLTTQGKVRQLEAAMAPRDDLGRLPQLLAATAFRKWLAADRPGTDDIGFRIGARRAPDGHSCAAVHFGNVSAITTPVFEAAPGIFEPSLHDGLCGLQFIMSTGERPLYGAFFLQLTSGVFLEATPLPSVFDGKAPFSGNLGWSIDLPWRLPEPFDYTIVVLAARFPVNEALDWWRESTDPEHVARRLSALGVRTLVAHHRVAP